MAQGAQRALQGEMLGKQEKDSFPRCRRPVAQRERSAMQEQHHRRITFEENSLHCWKKAEK
jgi:hypothetical protein